MGDNDKEINIIFELSGLVFDQLGETVMKLELIQNKYKKLEIDYTYLKRALNRITCTLTTKDYDEAIEVYRLLFNFPLPEASFDEYYKVESDNISCNIILETNIIH